MKSVAKDRGISKREVYQVIVEDQKKVGCGTLSFGGVAR